MTVPTPSPFEAELDKALFDAIVAGIGLANGIGWLSLGYGAKAAGIESARAKIKPDALAAHEAGVVAATSPLVDLNDSKYMLQFIGDPIDRFNMFIRKWCPHYSHLVDDDDNDGEEIRLMIAALEAKADKPKGAE